MIENYERSGPAIQDLREYIISIVPANTAIEIEYDDHSSIEFFDVSIHYPRIDFTSMHSEWTIDVDSPEAEAQLSRLGWTPETLDILYEKLDRANCISVLYSARPEWDRPFCTIGFKRSSTGLYSYGISDPDTTDNYFRSPDMCNSIFYKEGVMLQYDCGPHCYGCFPAE
ncbi:MAG TPA: hypothetical protein VK826_14320 [Bacteroidia bacterium]|nr:hypothetical protein [Bacteroidia bacterium]